MAKKFLEQFQVRFCEYEVSAISSENIGKFLEESTETLSRATRHLRYAQLKAFFNYVIETSNLNIKNPCSAAVLLKTFKNVHHSPRKILDKETVDEIIFNAHTVRDRLILELQARCGLRIGESLKITVRDVSDRKLVLRGPKSGKESEVAFVPEQIAKRLHDYIQQENLSPEDRLFPICYSTARAAIRRVGKRLNVVLTPHDLRRYSATHASRNGIPLEIVSKVILRHQDLKTTQAYLGRISEVEAIRWMDILHGR